MNLAQETAAAEQLAVGAPEPQQASQHERTGLLLSAIKHGRTAAICELLADHSLREVCEPCRYPALAAVVGYKAPRRNFTPLQYACTQHQDYSGEVVSLLVHNHCSVDNMGALRVSPLHLAAKTGLETAVTTLLQAGCDPCQLDPLNRMPIHMAATPAIRDLLRHAQEHLEQQQEADKDERWVLVDVADERTVGLSPDPEVVLLDSNASSAPSTPNHQELSAPLPASAQPPPLQTASPPRLPPRSVTSPATQLRPQSPQPLPRPPPAAAAAPLMACGVGPVAPCVDFPNGVVRRRVRQKPEALVATLPPTTSACPPVAAPNPGPVLPHNLPPPRRPSFHSVRSSGALNSPDRVSSRGARSSSGASSPIGEPDRDTGSGITRGRTSTFSSLSVSMPGPQPSSVPASSAAAAAAAAAASTSSSAGWTALTLPPPPARAHSLDGKAERPTSEDPMQLHNSYGGPLLTAADLLYPWRTIVHSLRRFSSGHQDSQTYESPQEWRVTSISLIERDDLTLKDVIGSGSFGKVYRGIWLKRHLVAVKMVPVPPSEQGPAAVIGAHNELQVLTRLQHRNIINLFGACHVDGFILLCMEYATAGSLSSFLHNDGSAYNWATVRRFAMEICAGMAYLHEQNIIHRDLKSPNILLTLPELAFAASNEPESCAKLECRICDFGLSLQRANARTMGRGCGTFCWMAPEVMCGKPPMPAIDVYSFAVILWELCVRQRPFQGLEPCQIVYHVCTNNLRPSLAEVRPRLAKKLIADAWQSDPEARPTFDGITKRLHEWKVVDEPPHPAHGRSRSSLQRSLGEVEGHTHETLQGFQSPPEFPGTPSGTRTPVTATELTPDSSGTTPSTVTTTAMAASFNVFTSDTTTRAPSYGMAPVDAGESFFDMLGRAFQMNKPQTASAKEQKFGDL